MEKNDIRKYLIITKEMAKFSHYISGNLYYTILLTDGIYQFPIATIEDVKTSYETTFPFIKLSSDLGTTSFYSSIRGSELFRWISKAIDSGDFIKIIY